MLVLVAAATLGEVLVNVCEHKREEGLTQWPGSTGFNQSILKEINPEYSLEALVIPFGPMLEQILLLLGVPIFLGLVFSHYFPNATKKITKPAQILSILLFIGMVTVSFSQNFQIFVDNIFYVFFIVMLHNASALMSGYFTGRLGKLPERDVRSLTVETGIQNSGLGLILLFNNSIFPAEIWHGHYGGMLFITAWWGIWHIISGLSVAYYFRRKPLQA